jgi:hypothetical protein
VRVDVQRSQERTPRLLSPDGRTILSSNDGSGGVPVEYVLFPDEGHGFLRKENRVTPRRPISPSSTSTREVRIDSLIPRQQQ